VIKDAEMLGLMIPRTNAQERRCRCLEEGLLAGIQGQAQKSRRGLPQLQRYREALLQSALLVVCDFDRLSYRHEFQWTVCVPRITNDHIDRPENLRILRACFENPGFLKRSSPPPKSTNDLAVQIAEIAKMLQTRESVELADAKSRAK